MWAGWMSRHAVHRNIQAMAASPTASHIPPSVALMPHTTQPITSHLAQQRCCWGLFIPTGAREAIGKRNGAREMKDGEGGLSSTGLIAGNVGLEIPALPCQSPHHACHPGWDPLEHPPGSRSRCWGLSVGLGSAHPYTLLPL